MANNHYQLPETVPIDWKRCLQTVNDNEDLANELLAMFIKELPEFRASFESSVADYNLLQIRKLSHKLKGLVSYCAVPRIEAMIQYIDEAIKVGSTREVKETVHCLVKEIDSVIEYYSVDASIHHDRNE
jgi:HPt (histidine-containing phosphotransfer) domain-containing protein